MRRRTFLLAAAVMLAGCSTELEPVADESVDAPVEDTGGDAVGGTDAGGPTSSVDRGAGFGILDAGDPAELAAAVADEPCDPEMIGEDHGPLEAMYALVDGELAGLCHGAPSTSLIEAWLALAAVSPPEQLEPVVVLAGFASTDDTVAFAGAADEEQYERFLIAVDLVSAEENPAETRLTMVHELAHVFTQTPGQLDVTADPDQCDGYWNGAGCLVPDGYVMAWIEAFWSDEDLAAQPEDGSADPDLGQERCELDPMFVGPYAASSPEEDLAESFSAFVFDLDVPASAQPKLDWFEQYPELSAFRDLQRVSGLPAVPNTFEACG
jgi:hypothetical protein